jgi:hypothetical protein
VLCASLHKNTQYLCPERFTERQLWSLFAGFPPICATPLRGGDRLLRHTSEEVLLLTSAGLDRLAKLFFTRAVDGFSIYPTIGLATSGNAASPVATQHNLPEFVH